MPHNLLPYGVPASLLLTNQTMLQAGIVVLSIAGLLVLGGISAVSYKIFYKQAVKKIEASKATASK